jgi:digeranylgeranylglycerophospholipid reductase
MRIATVGGGFAGLMVARELARKGFKVDLFEEHPRVGFPKHCTGLISESTVRMIGAPIRRNVESWYEGVVFETPTRNYYVKTERIARVDRVTLERDLLEEAEAYGTTPLLGVRVEQITPSKKPALVFSGERSFYDVVFLAEGLFGRLRRQLGSSHNLRTTFGINLDYKEKAASDALVHIVIEPSIPSSVFGWWFSVEDYTVVGAIGWKWGAARRLATLIEKRLGLKGITSIYGGRVVHGPPLEPQRQPLPVVIVGDAAGMNKPLTGGGLYPNSLFTTLLSALLDKKGLVPAAAESYTRVYIILRKQWRLARKLLQSSILSMLVEEASRVGIRLDRGETLDYDDHTGLVKNIIRRYPLKSLILGLAITIRNPTLALDLLRGAVLS